MGELLTTSAVDVTDFHSVVVVRTSASVVTIGSGASATAPQSIRVGGPGSLKYYTRQYTSANTLTSTTGGATGTVWMYSLPVTTGTLSSTSLQTVVINNLGGTLTCTGTPTCTVVTSQSQLGQNAIKYGVYLASATMTAGAPATFDVSGVTTQSQNVDAWAKGCMVTNNTGGAVTINITNGINTPAPLLSTVSVAANSTVFISFTELKDELVFFERGIKMTASANSALYVSMLWRVSSPAFSPEAPR